MAIKVEGGRGLHFVGTFDISEIQEKSRQILTMYQDLQKASNAPASGQGKNDAYRKSQAALKDALNDSRLALQKLREEGALHHAQQEKNKSDAQNYKKELLRLKVAEQELNNQYKAGRVALVEYNLEQKKLAQAQKEAAKHQQASAQAIKDSVKARRDQEEQIERNIKSLQQETTLLEKMQREADIYARGMAGTTNPVLVDKYNAKLQETLRIIQQLSPKGNAPIALPGINTKSIKAEVDEQVNVIGRLGEGWKASSKEQVGAIERVKAQLKSLRELAPKASAAALPGINREIEATERELKRLVNVGKTGFRDTDDAAKKVEGTLNRLKRAAELYKQASLTTTDPERLAKYNRKLQETEQRIRQVTNQGKAGFDEMGNRITKNGGRLSGFIGTLKGLAGTIGIVFGVDQLIQWGRELFDLAKKAEGIELAFSRVGSAQQLQELRDATRGTVSDLDLMKAAVKASNFKIPIDTLGKGLAFAQQRAKDTGQEVDYLVESLVTGIGRKSPLILDNLGLSVVEVQREFQKTGDFATAVGTIIDREMERSGDAVETLGEKTGGMSSMWDNAKKGVAGFFRQLFNPGAMDVSKVTSLTDELATNMGATLEQMGKLTKGQLDTIAFQLTAQREGIKKERKALEEELKKTLAKPGNNQGEVDMLIRRKKAYDEELKATQNVLLNVNKQTQALEEQQRIKSGILSVTELQAKAEALRTEAMNILPYADEDRKRREKLLSEAEDLDKQISEILGKGIKERSEKEDDAYQKSLDKRIALLTQIAKVEAEYTRKALTPEKEEEKALQDRFKYLREEIERFNSEVAPALKVDLKLIDPIEDKALQALRYRHETEALKESLDKQKSLYEQYEAYKKDFGEKKARERFESELDLSRTYTQQLQEELGKLSAIEPANLSGGQVERMEYLEKELEAGTKAQQAYYDDLLKGLTTYEQQRNLIIEKYGEDRQKLLEQGDITAMEALDERFKQSINALDDAYAKELDAFKQLFAGVDELTDRNARSAVAVAEQKLKELVAQGRISKEMQTELERLLKSSTAAIKDRLPQRLANLAGELRNVAGAVGEIDAGFGRVLGTLSHVIDNVVSIKDNLDAMQSAFRGGDILGGLTGAMGVIGGVFAAISVAKGIADTMNAKSEARQRAAAAQQQYLADMQINANNAIVENLAKQLELIKEIYGTERVDEYSRSLKRIKKEYDNIAESAIKSRTASEIEEAFGKHMFALSGYSEELDEVIAKYNQGLVGFTNIFFNENYDPTKPLQDITELFEDLTDPDKKINALADLEELMDKGLLDEATAATVQNLLTLEEQFRDTLNAMNEELTGFSLDSLISDIQSIFADGGENAGEAFSKNFNEQVQKSLLQKLTRDALEKQLQGYYDLFAKFAKDGLDKDEIEELKGVYDKVIADAQKQLADLEATSGVDIDNSEKAKAANQNTLSGAIRASLTEETGGKLAGILQGQFGLQKLQLVSLEGLRVDMGDLLDVGRQQISIQMRIDTNTRLTYEGVNRMESTLNTIATNTKPPQSSRDLGLG